jgi:hypothetical protein
MYENYREPELEQLIDPENSKMWMNVATNLDMVGQLAIAKKGDAAKGNPIPYMAINKRLHKLLKTLCPDSEESRKYKASTMPLEALLEIGLCVEKNYFDTIQVWYDAKDKDPFIVGIVSGSQRWDNQYFLIGRFGDELLPLEILEQKAIAKLTDTFRKRLENARSRLNELIEEYLEKDSNTEISISRGHGSIW